MYVEIEDLRAAELGHRCLGAVRIFSCSIKTKSEIVVPVYAHGKVIGEIDIDSHDFAAFTNEDRMLLEETAHLVGAWIEQHPG